MPSYRSIQEECCEANRALPATGLVDLTFGNVSVADRALGVFAISGTCQRMYEEETQKIS